MAEVLDTVSKFLGYLLVAIVLVTMAASQLNSLRKKRGGDRNAFLFVFSRICRIWDLGAKKYI